MQNFFTPFNPKSATHWLALGFGSGLLKPAPGTWGSLVGALLVVLATHLSVNDAWVFGVDVTAGLVYPMLVVFVCAIGVVICGRTARDIGVHDHGAIVWDEIAGMFVTMAFVPVSVTTLIIGFLLFRVFDILKPWPIGWLDQKVTGGWGIMLDDIVAGVIAGGLTYALYATGLIG